MWPRWLCILCDLVPWASEVISESGWHQKTWVLQRRHEQMSFEYAACSITVPVGTRLHWSTGYQPLCSGKWESQCCWREAQRSKRNKRNWTKTANRTCLAPTCTRRCVIMGKWISLWSNTIIDNAGRRVWTLRLDLETHLFAGHWGHERSRGVAVSPNRGDRRLVTYLQASSSSSKI